MLFLLRSNLRTEQHVGQHSTVRFFEKISAVDSSLRFRFLHSRLRTATLRNDFEGTAVLINLLLRNYLHYNLYSQAQKLVLKSVFPDHASNNEWARYLYYLGAFRKGQSNVNELRFLVVFRSNSSNTVGIHQSASASSHCDSQSSTTNGDRLSTKCASKEWITSEFSSSINFV